MLEGSRGGGDGARFSLICVLGADLGLLQWSKAIYTYGMAVSLWELGDKTEAAKFMQKVPELRQKIAGKSIPLEVPFSPSFTTILV